jgi:hypothetical protein
MHMTDVPTQRRFRRHDGTRADGARQKTESGRIRPGPSTLRTTQRRVDRPEAMHFGA